MAFFSYYLSIRYEIDYTLYLKEERDTMDYKKTAQAILDHVGGSKNIVSAAGVGYPYQYVFRAVACGTISRSESI